VDSNSEIQDYNFYPMLLFHRKFSNSVTPQKNFLQKITFDMLYNNIFLIRIHSRTLFIILRM